LWQANDLGHLKLPQGLPNLVHFPPIWGNGAMTTSIENEKLSTIGF